LAEKTFQEAKFRGSELDLFAVDRNLVAQSIQAYSQVVDDVGRLFLVLEATLDGLDPLEKDLYAKWLGDIIVSSQREADELVGFLSLGRQHENWDFASLFSGAQPPTNVQAIDYRQHQVEENQVGQQGLSLAQAFLAIVGHQGFIPFALKIVSEDLAQGPLILNDENLGSSHGYNLTPW
jgi:hypothetical protein